MISFVRYSAYGTIMTIIVLFSIFHKSIAQDLSWIKNIGSVGATEDLDAHSICNDATGNIYIGGSFSNSVDFNGETTDNEVNSGAAQTMYIAKYNTSGTRQWLIKMDAATCTNVSPLDMVSGASNLYVIGSFHNSVDFDPGAGTTTLTSAGSADIFVAKYTLSTGALVWAYSTGGSNDDIGLGIALDASENVFITGSYQGYSTGPIQVPDFKMKEATTIYPSLPDNSGINEMFIGKYTTDFDFSWLVAGGAGSGSDEASDVVVNASGEVYVTGYTARRGVPTSMDFDPGAGTSNLFATMVAATASNTGRNAFLAKYANDGTFSFVKNIGQPSLGSFSCEPNAMDMDGSGNLFITGYIESGGSVDFDPVGTRSLTSAGGLDAFVSKYTNAGIYDFAYVMGSTGFDVGSGINAAATGGIVVTGFISEAVDMNPEATGGAQTRGAASNRSIFLGEYSDAFSFKWCHGMGNTDYDNSGVVALINEKESVTYPVYAYGYFAGTVDFDPDNAGGDQTGDATEDTYFAKYTSISLPVEWISFEVKHEENIQLIWVTATEKNNQYFSIEKSTDGKVFNEIGRLNGNGTSSEVHKYVWPYKWSGENCFFRLKQVDWDGIFNYSKIIYVASKEEYSKHTQLTYLFHSNTLHLELKENFLNDESLNLELISSFGNVLKKENVRVDNENREILWKLNEQLPYGYYFVRIYYSNRIQTIKFLLH